MRRPGCDNCLIRNIFLTDHFKNGIVHHRAFKDRDPDGISMTETRDEFKGLDDLEDYFNVVSEKLAIKVGAAVMDASDCRSVGLTWRPDPHNDHKFGHLHVLGPGPEKMTDDLRKECARLANLTEWSRGPIQKPH